MLETPEQPKRSNQLKRNNQKQDENSCSKSLSRMVEIFPSDLKDRLLSAEETAKFRELLSNQEVEQFHIFQLKIQDRESARRHQTALVGLYAIIGIIVVLLLLTMIPNVEPSRLERVANTVIPVLSQLTTGVIFYDIGKSSSKR